MYPFVLHLVPIPWFVQPKVTMIVTMIVQFLLLPQQQQQSSSSSPSSCWTTEPPRPSFGPLQHYCWCRRWRQLSPSVACVTAFLPVPTGPPSSSLSSGEDRPVRRYPTVSSTATGSRAGMINVTEWWWWNRTAKNLQSWSGR